MHTIKTLLIAVFIVAIGIIIGCDDNSNNRNSKDDDNSTLIITEIKGDSDIVGDYIEIYNADDEAFALGGCTLTDGVDDDDDGEVDNLFTFDTQSLAAKGYAVVCINDDQSYDALAVPCVAGTGSFGISGKQEVNGITLSCNDVVIDAVIAPIAADASLNLDNASLSLKSDALSSSSNDTASNWFASTAVLGAGDDKGTPGLANDSTSNAVASSTVIISEILGRGDGVDDYIELYNTTDAAVNIGGYVLTDTKDMSKTITIAANTTLAAGEYSVVCTNDNGDYPDISCVSITESDDGFGIGGKEDDGIFLLNGDGELLDVVIEPISADDSLDNGANGALELSTNRLTKWHNDRTAHWNFSTSAIGSTATEGTPGAANSFTLTSE